MRSICANYCFIFTHLHAVVGIFQIQAGSLLMASMLPFVTLIFWALRFPENASSSNVVESVKSFFILNVLVF